MPEIAEEVTSPTGQVLIWITERYYEVARSYAVAPGMDSPERVFRRGQLDSLAAVGGRLADAIGWAEPDWAAMVDLAAPAVESGTEKESTDV